GSSIRGLFEAAGSQRPRQPGQAAATSAAGAQPQPECLCGALGQVGEGGVADVAWASDLRRGGRPGGRALALRSGRQTGAREAQLIVFSTVSIFDLTPVRLKTFPLSYLDAKLGSICKSLYLNEASLWLNATVAIRSSAR